VQFSQRTVCLAGRSAILTASLLSVLAVYPAWAAEVYKSVDVQGHVTYSDRPNTTGAQKTAVTVQAPDPTEAARLAKEQAILRAEDDQRKKEQLIASQAKDQEDHAKKARCENARNRYNVLKDSGRLFRLDANGNRAYYTDAEADAKREEARQAVSVACAK
jgi:hypothetical protein